MDRSLVSNLVHSRVPQHGLVLLLLIILLLYIYSFNNMFSCLLLSVHILRFGMAAKGIYIARHPFAYEYQYVLSIHSIAFPYSLLITTYQYLHPALY